MTHQTVSTLLADGIAKLSASREGNESPKIDAQAILAFVLEKNRTWLMTWPDKEVSTADSSQFYSAIARRCLGEPVAYITGVQEFWSLPFSVEPCTLIPRPDTEILVEAVLARFDQPKLALLDLGTGTGAIALALASEQRNWNIKGVDFNHGAVKLALKNAEQLGLTHVDFIQSDWFSSISSQQRFNVIVSNPPYIEHDDIHLSQGGVRFEPQSALVANDDGLGDIKHIAKQSLQFLSEDGALFVEHGWQQGPSVRAIFESLGYQQVETLKDYSGNDRITLGYLS